MIKPHYLHVQTCLILLSQSGSYTVWVLKWHISTSRVLQCGHFNHKRYGFIFTLFVLFFTYFNIFFRTSQSQPHVDATAETFSCLLSTLFSKWCHEFKQRRRHFSNLFPIFYQLLLFRFFTIAGYFMSETIMVLSDGNINTFFHSKTRNKCNATYLFQRQTDRKSLMSHLSSLFNCNTRVFPPPWL